MFKPHVGTGSVAINRAQDTATEEGSRFLCGSSSHGHVTKRVKGMYVDGD